MREEVSELAMPIRAFERGDHREWGGKIAGEVGRRKTKRRPPREQAIHVNYPPHKEDEEKKYTYKNERTVDEDGPRKRGGGKGEKEEASMGRRAAGSRKGEGDDLDTCTLPRVSGLLPRLKTINRVNVLPNVFLSLNIAIPRLLFFCPTPPPDHVFRALLPSRFQYYNQFLLCLYSVKTVRGLKFPDCIPSPPISSSPAKLRFLLLLLLFKVYPSSLPVPSVFSPNHRVYFLRLRWSSTTCCRWDPTGFSID